MAEIDELLRSEPPVEPSSGFARAVMQAVETEKHLPPPATRSRLAVVAGALLLLVVVAAALALATLAAGGPPAPDAWLPTPSARLRTFLEWAAHSGSRLLVAALGLVAVLLLVRRAERSV